MIGVIVGIMFLASAFHPLFFSFLIFPCVVLAFCASLAFKYGKESIRPKIILEWKLV
jgi:hypothetical protein